MLPPAAMVSSSAWATAMATFSSITTRRSSASSTGLLGGGISRKQRVGPAGGVAADHLAAELGKPLGMLRHRRVVRPLSLMLGREAERRGDAEVLERAHLPVEPALGVRTEPVGPGQAGAQIGHAE